MDKEVPRSPEKAVQKRLTAGCEPGPPGEVLRTPNLGLGSVVRPGPSVPGRRLPQGEEGRAPRSKGDGVGHVASHLQMFFSLF